MMPRLLTFILLLALAGPAWAQTAADSIRADWNEISVRFARISSLIDQLPDTVEVVRVDTFFTPADTVQVTVENTDRIDSLVVVLEDLERRYTALEAERDSLAAAVVRDTVYVPRAPVVRPIPERSTANLVESRFFADSTGYEVYVQGIDTLVAIYDTSGTLRIWYATHGDFTSYQVDPGAEIVTVPRLYWDLTLDERYHGGGENRSLDIVAIKGVTDSIMSREDPGPDPDTTGGELLAWSSGDPINLGPVPMGSTFAVETRFTVDSWSRPWQRVVGKSGGPGPVHWWILEATGVGRTVWFRVRINGQLSSVAAGDITAGEPVDVRASYDGAELVLVVNGEETRIAAPGTRNDDPSRDAWIWLPGAPDTRLLDGSIQFVRIYE